MRENDIAGKCAATLIGLAAAVGVAILVSRGGGGAGDEPVPIPSAPAPSAASAARAPAATGAKPAAVPAPAPVTEADRLARRSFQLEMENARLRGRLDDMLNWILDNVRGTFPLPEGQMANLQVAPVDTNLATSGDLAELLRLNDEEIDRLDAAFLGTRSVLQELETENISVDRPSDSQVVLNIPPYAEDGQLVREELYNELKKTLGAARFDRFLEVAETGLDEQFEYFGEADRTLQFETLQDEQSGEAQLFVRDERVRPAKDDPLRQNITASERIVTELPAEYYFYWNWLPDSVTRFSRSN